MLFVYRYLCGTQDLHKDMEKKLSNFHGRDDALLYASGYDANIALFKVLLGKVD